MVVHRHDLRSTLARLCRILTKSPAAEIEVVTPVAEPVEAPVVLPAEAVAPPPTADAAPPPAAPPA